MAVTARLFFVTGHVLGRCSTIHCSLSRTVAFGTGVCGRCDVFTQTVHLALEGSACCAAGFRLSFAIPVPIGATRVYALYVISFLRHGTCGAGVCWWLWATSSVLV